MIPRRSKLLKGLLVSPVVVLLGYYVLLFIGQRSLVFPAPTGKASSIPPADAEALTLRDDQSREVKAWFLPARTAKPASIALFFHGNGERAEDWLDQFGELRDAGAGIVVVEYPGYGIAPGAPTEESLTAAALAAHDWICGTREWGDVPILAYGRSLGGGVATRVATRRPLAGLILESTFTDLRAFAPRFYAPGFLVRDQFDNLAELQKYKGPLLVMHGERDEVAPFTGGHALARAVPGAEFVPMSCGHNNCDRPSATIVRFLRDRGLVPSAP